MKVLQVNCVYNKGSTGKITYDIHSYLKDNGIESVVCYGRGDKVKKDNVYKTCGEFYSKVNHFLANVTGVMYGGCFFSTNKLISIIKKEKPDIVHLQCINGYFVNIYRLINWLKKNNIKTVLTLHAEFMYTANCGYALECNNWKSGCGNCPRLKNATSSYLLDNTHKSWMKMKKAFDGFKDNLVVASVSPWLMERAKLSPIMKDLNHVTILNGLDTSIFHYYDKNDLIKKYKKSDNDEKTILHVTPSFSLNKDNIKGGYYVCELAKRLLKDNIKILVAGPYDKNIEVPSNVILLGKITNQVELAKLYSLADVTLLTSKKETFSMVTAESLCCGTPVVGFKAGAPEMIAIKKYSDFVEFGNINELEKSIKKYLIKIIKKENVSYESNNNYSKDTMGKNYLDLYRKVSR